MTALISRELPRNLGSYLLKDGGARRLLVLIRAYFDESGHEDDGDCPALVVAGLAGPPFAWDEFESLWRATLEDRGITDFHSADVDARKKDFKDYTRADRDALFAALIAALEGRNLFPFAVITNIEARRELIAASGFEAVEAAYVQCIRRAMELILTTFRNLREEGEEVEFVFDQKNEYLGAAGEAYEQIRSAYGSDLFAGFGFKNSRVVVQLHAADFIAHEITVHEKRLRSGLAKRFWMTELERLYPPPRGIPIIGISKVIGRFAKP